MLLLLLLLRVAYFAQVMIMMERFELLVLLKTLYPTWAATATDAGHI